MINILDALKAKHPEATGDTIGEVIATMESGGGGSKIFKVIPYFADPFIPSRPKGFIKSINGYNAETGYDYEFYTFDEMWQLLNESGFGTVLTYSVSSDYSSKTIGLLFWYEDEEEGGRVIYANCTGFSIPTEHGNKTTYVGLEHITFTPSDGFLCETHEYNFPMNNEDDENNITVKIIPFVASEYGGFIKGYDNNSASGFALYTYAELVNMVENATVLYTFDIGGRSENANQTLYRIDFNGSVFTARSIAIDSIDYAGGNPENPGECHITRKEVSLSQENGFAYTYSNWFFAVTNSN